MGGGTNSTAMLVGLWERGMRPDAITFADTGGEKPYTYEHIITVNNWLSTVNFPNITVLGPVMPQQKIDKTLEGECLRLGVLPSKAYGFGSCSDKWKLEPQRRFDREFVKQHNTELKNLTRLIGFDADEHKRVARAKNLAHLKKNLEAFPLYEWGWGREECVEAIARAGLPQPGKSACFFCPSSKKHEILELGKQYPELLQRALEMERKALAGEGPSPQTRSKGLGRSFAWITLVEEKNIDNICDFGTPDQDCGCYDGD